MSEAPVLIRRDPSPKAAPRPIWPYPSDNWGKRVKNDEHDATDLVDLLRLGRLAEA